jgi:hypothetical protein
MSSRRDFEIEQTIFLGGQVSRDHPDFKEISRLTPDLGFIYLLLSKKEEWKKDPNKTERAKKIIELIGETEFVRTVTELTRLSMILGDQRARYSMKGVNQPVIPTTINGTP